MTNNIFFVALCLVVSFVEVMHGHSHHRLRREVEDCDTSSQQTDGTWEWCEFRLRGLLTKDGSLVPVVQMGVNLDHTFGKSLRDNGELVAQAIHERCGANPLSSESDSPFATCVSEILKMGHSGVLSKMNSQIFARADLESKETAADFPPVEMIYPNLTCHPNYNSDRSDPSKGEGYLLEGYKFCHYMKGGGPNKPPECLKICMAEYVGLIDTRWQNNIRVQWNSYSEMVNNVRHFLVGFNTKSGQQIVQNILEKCRNSMKLVERSRTNPCHTSKWRDFFICLDSVWDCASMTGARLLDY